METPSLEELPTKAKEDPSPHELRLSPTGHQPSISLSRGMMMMMMMMMMIIIIISSSIIIIIIIIKILLIMLIIILLLIYLALTVIKYTVSVHH